MTARPLYFETIRQKANGRWNQLEADPELAGPWHALFKQVQSPRHVLSELLQNADDANATEASVLLDDGFFIFEHNGEDFSEDNFASICRFAYSNKRAMRTIGFRGIGFKSTFSLGDEVELITPTLAVGFQRNRFTEPSWLQGHELTKKKTRVKVRIADDLIYQEIRKNLDDWLSSPVSMLFFRNLRRLQVEKSLVHWESFGPGPVPDSEWMALNGNAENPYLLVRSKDEKFPPEALEEIKKERSIAEEGLIDVPSCRVEIVLGAKGKFYVVLPTEVETQLPFACNAPFIQDPARLKIKDPETSPTNRWLLDRLGELAAGAMLTWLESGNCSMVDKSGAYEFLPYLDKETGALGAASARLIETSFQNFIRNKPVLLIEDGRLVEPRGSIVVPEKIFEIWSSEEAHFIIAHKSLPPLCNHVSQSNKMKLVRLGFVEEFTKRELLNRLKEVHPSKPASWQKLLVFWEYIAQEITRWGVNDADAINIIPVQGEEALFSGKDVVRLGEKRLLDSDKDWNFLAFHMRFLNQNWTRYLAEQKRLTQEETRSNNAAQAAFEVLKKVGLEVTSDADEVIERVACKFFGSTPPALEDCVQFTQIAAKLRAKLGDSFKVYCADENLKSIANNGVYYDEDGRLEELFPITVQETQFLHSDYTSKFTSCSREEWLQWANSDHSRLMRFAQFEKKSRSFWSREDIEKEGRMRGLKKNLNFHYVTNQFLVDDWDFRSDFWEHWEHLAKEDASIWQKIVQKIIEQPESYWSNASNARLLQTATSGTKRQVHSESLLSNWLIKLAKKPCLPDTRGNLHVPCELMRRTPETESFMDVEPFVLGSLDTEGTRKLLDLLGVRNEPSGPERLLDRLRALAGYENAPASEVDKWYRRIDQLIDTCSTAGTQTIKDAFNVEKLILAQDGSWTTTSGISLSEDDEIMSGMPVVRVSVRDLALWRRLGVADYPSVELAIKWLDTLPTEHKLTSQETLHVKAILKQYPFRTWSECARWLNLLGEWVPVEALSYCISMQSLVRWSHLHDWVKRKTADLQALSREVLQSEPFSSLLPLANEIEDRFNQPPTSSSDSQSREWLIAFGRQLMRVELNNQDDTDRIRNLAIEIARTNWIDVKELEVIPYLDGIPAGTSTHTDILWREGKLFVCALSKAKLAKRVPEEIGKTLPPELRTALSYAFERKVDEIREYLEENFTLTPDADITSLSETQPNVLELSRDINSDELPTAVISSLPKDESDLSVNQEDIDEIFEANDSQSESSHIFPTQSEQVHKPRPQATTHHHRPDLMTRYAKSIGFQPKGEDRFVDTTGNWLGRSLGTKFPWAKYSSSGNLLRYYLDRELCLENDPLQIEADVWSLIEQKPELYAFILTNRDGSPVEITGSKLLSLKDEGKLSILPATYRLVYVEDRL